MNILHLQTGLNLTCGVSKTIYLIAKHSTEGFKHFVIAMDGDAGDKFTDAKINVTFLNSDDGSERSLLGKILAIKKFIKKNKIDIVHSHHRYLDLIAYIISFFCKIKRITSVQSFVYGKKLFSYKSPVLLAASESVKKHLCDYYNIKEKRIVIFNNFVDTQEISKGVKTESIKKELGIPEDSYIIGYVGRFSVKEKGIDILINAFEKFYNENRNSFLLMVGKGEDIKNIKIPANVIVLTAKENIFDYYRIFDCLVLPSRIDPFPLTVLEAGMMKVPFIGANVNGIPEIIEDNITGLLFDKENINMLKEKMKLLYNERKFAKEIADNLYQKVADNHNHIKDLEKLEKIYKEL